MLKLVDYTEEEEKEDLARILKDVPVDDGLFVVVFTQVHLQRRCPFCAAVGVPIDADQLMIFILWGFVFLLTSDARCVV